MNNKILNIFKMIFDVEVKFNNGTQEQFSVYAQSKKEARTDAKKFGKVISIKRSKLKIPIDALN